MLIKEIQSSQKLTLSEIKLRYDIRVTTMLGSYLPPSINYILVPPPAIYSNGTRENAIVFVACSKFSYVICFY